MTPFESEADAHTSIDGILRQTGWDPRGKSPARTEIPSISPSHHTLEFLVNFSRAIPFETHALVCYLLASASAFGPNQPVDQTAGELGWLRTLSTETPSRASSRSLTASRRDTHTKELSGRWSKGE